MTRAALFWILMLITLVIGLWWGWPSDSYSLHSFRPVGISVLQFVLFALLGWQVFGPAVKG